MFQNSLHLDYGYKKEGPVIPVFAAIAGGWAAGTAAAAGLTAIGVGGAMASIITGVAAGLGGMMASTLASGGSLGDVFEDPGRLLVGIGLSALGGYLFSPAATGANAASSGANAASSAATAASEPGILEAIGNVGTEFKNAFGRVGDALSADFGTFADQISNSWNSWGTSLHDAALSDGFSGSVAKFLEVGHDAVSAFLEIPSKITDALTGVDNFFSGNGQSGWGNLWNTNNEMAQQFNLNGINGATDTTSWMYGQSPNTYTPIDVMQHAAQSGIQVGGSQYNMLAQQYSGMTYEEALAFDPTSPLLQNPPSYGEMATNPLSQQGRMLAEQNLGAPPEAGIMTQQASITDPYISPYSQTAGLSNTPQLAAGPNIERTSRRSNPATGTAGGGGLLADRKAVVPARTPSGNLSASKGLGVGGGTYANSVLEQWRQYAPALVANIEAAQRRQAQFAQSYGMQTSQGLMA